LLAGGDNKALSGEGNPSFGTVMKVCAALGVKLVPQPVRAGVTENS
jgi:DNA-binding phage protein